VRSARGRKLSSTRWLERQLNDPFVAEAKRQGYLSRAAFKLSWLDDKYKILGPGKRVLDLGAAPGSWTQIVIERLRDKGEVFAVDKLEMEDMAGATTLKMDFLSGEAEERLLAVLGGPLDVVLSDMASPTTGHRQTDHLRTMALCEAAYDFATQILKPGGCFIAKVLRGGTEAELLNRAKRDFRNVHHAKPPASRAGSSELYLVALSFEPPAPDDPQ
jgi:23S rRNA (uridine2552-2'-O)-methyltransferase